MIEKYYFFNYYLNVPNFRDVFLFFSLVFCFCFFDYVKSDIFRNADVVVVSYNFLINSNYNHAGKTVKAQIERIEHLQQTMKRVCI